MSRHLSWLVPVVVVGSVLGACGGQSFGPPSGDDGGSGGSGEAGTHTTGGSGLSGSGTGGSHSAGGSSSTGGTSGKAGSGNTAGTGVGGQCDIESYADDVGGNVPVRIVNGTSKPIYLGSEMLGCAGGAFFQVADSKGQPLPVPGFCQTTCVNQLKGVAIGCPAIACAIGSTVTLAPGESNLSLWSGLYLETVMLPLSCRGGTGVDQCQRIASVEPGDYIFTAQAGTNLQCSMLDGCGMCVPNQNGGCNTFGATIAEPLQMAKLAVTLDGSYGIGGPGGGGMVREVVIEFK